MNKENTKKLLEKYPNIFRQAHLSIHDSCMARLFECGDGWYQIIDTLCSTIQFRIDNPQYINATPWYKKSINWVIVKINNCLFYISYKIAKEDPNRCHVYYDGQYDKLPALTRILRKLGGLLPMFKETYIKPNVKPLEFGQVKEKFGQLTIYPDYSNDELNGMISMASAMSYKICEVCGKPGNLCVRGNYDWYKTLCSDCITNTPECGGYTIYKRRED